MMDDNDIIDEYNTKLFSVMRELSHDHRVKQLGVSGSVHLQLDVPKDSSHSSIVIVSKNAVIPLSQGGSGLSGETDIEFSLGEMKNIKLGSRKKCEDCAEHPAVKYSISPFPPTFFCSKCGFQRKDLIKKRDK